MSEVTTIARPYAKAAFDFAVEHQAVDKWADMLTFAACVADNADMAALLTADANAQTLSDLFLKVCGDQLDEYGQNFIKVMAENRRLKVLPAVAEQFMALKAELNKLVVAHVLSAYRLTKAEQKKIAATLEKRFECTVELECQIDKSLVAGMIIKAGDLVIDGSLRGKLDRLADTLQS